MSVFHAKTGLAAPARKSLELVCPAGSLPALKAAVDNGANSVYLGFRDATNARNFAGLNFDAQAISEGITYAHDRGAKVLLALNTYPQPTGWQLWREAVDRAASAGVDAVIMADMGPLADGRKQHRVFGSSLSGPGSAAHHEALSLHQA